MFERSSGRRLVLVMSALGLVSCLSSVEIGLDVESRHENDLGRHRYDVGEHEFGSTVPNVLDNSEKTGDDEKISHLVNYGFHSNQTQDEGLEEPYFKQLPNISWSTLVNFNINSSVSSLPLLDTDLEDQTTNLTILTNLNFILNSTTQPNTNSEDSTHLGWLDIALIMLYSCIIAGTLIGNTLVIAAVATTRRLRTVTNCFVMSLAVADWLVGMFVMPIKVVYHLSNNIWNFGLAICKVWIALDVMLCTSSILSLCTISIDRYLAITRPLAYSRRRRSKRLALAMISCVWVSSIAITSPPMFGWLNYEKEIKECEYHDDPYYVVYSALGSFFVPLFVMLYVYARIACVIARRQKTIQKDHKYKDKRYCETEGVDEVGLSMHRVVVDGCMKSSKSIENQRCSRHIRPTLTATFTFLNTEPKKSSSDSISFWTQLHCLGNSKKFKQDQTHRKLTLEAGVSSASEIPSPSTLISVGGPSSLTNTVLLRTGIDSRIKINNSGERTLNNGPNKTTTRTGSRLCNHNLTNTSPPISIIHRLQPSSSLAIRDNGFSDERLKSTCRVWTVEDEEREDEVMMESKVTERLCRSTLNLNGCHQCSDDIKNEELYIGTNSMDDLRTTLRHQSLPYTNFRIDSTTKGSEPTKSEIPTRINYSTNRQSQALHCSRGKLQSQSCSHLLNKNWTTIGQQSHIFRSKSAKVKVSNQLSDLNQQHSGPSRDFTTGRVASFKRETKTAQTLAAVVGGFIICWLPFFVTYVIGPFIKPKLIPKELMEFFVWLGWGNSAINPAIYAFYNPDFRSAFWRLTIHKCNGILKFNRQRPDRGSPRRYDREIPQRTSA